MTRRPFLMYAELMQLAVSDEIVAAIIKDRIEDLARRRPGIGFVLSVKTP